MEKHQHHAADGADGALGSQPKIALEVQDGSRSAGQAGQSVSEKSEKKVGPLAAELMKALSEYVAALVKADGGELYVVSASQDDVHVHLAGTCAGCPGATMTRERLLEPTVRGVIPKATLKVTTGWRIPEGATRVDPS
ncbi:NifU family protein [Labilithrix luteola]|uniref:NifU family protein n=1 Tax=Labilithrix luteola TaxID=1391654 RepID=UPI0011BA8787|nr:NifU family protein [Labilithrix luteola]